ncbi:hypothetical protein L573_2618 [Bordetella holmesii H620]|nr:hypothetical protein D560_2030 [Bordetella holmesii ATCC 51541]KAK89543.1 hypothetical protein L573_2618 [Bordetella holmesii H620]
MSAIQAARRQPRLRGGTTKAAGSGIDIRGVRGVTAGG